MKTEKIEYRTQEQFDEIVHCVINGNYSQASKFTVEYGFYATDFKNFVDNTEWVHNHEYFNVVDLYWVIEGATTIRMKQNFEEENSLDFNIKR